MSQTKIYDIAGAAGVSLATVSRVLNHPEKVKKETRERVMRIINEKGYKPNANARGLASRRSTTVAVVVPTLTRASVSEMIQGIVDSAKQFGYSIRLFVLSETNREEAWLEIVASSVDGILLTIDEVDEELLDIIKFTPVPVVLVNVLLENSAHSCVGINGREALFKLTEQLIKDGRRRIQLLVSKMNADTNVSRIQGYAEAMAQAGLEADIIETSGKLEENEPQFQELVTSNLPEVVIGVRDSIAISYMNVAIHNGIKIPEQLEVIGLQNTRYAELSNPKLSCIETPIYAIGNEAMTHLTTLMKADKKAAHVAHIEIPYKFIKRESTR